MTDGPAKVSFLVLQEQVDGRIYAKVIPTFSGLRNREHHRHVLTSIAVNCVRQLGLIKGMEAALEEVCELAYETRFEALPRIECQDELEHDIPTDPDD